MIGEELGLSITAEKVRFSYGEIVALDGLSLRIPAGGFAGIVGPNGSGKSTFIKAASRVIQPQGGKIFLGERDITTMTLTEVARTVAVAPQEVSLTFEISVLDFVLLGRLPHLGRFSGENRRDREVAEEAMSMTDTLSFHSRKMAELSGGEKQRVIIAKALAQQPRVLLLDEPTSHLDIHHQMDILSLIQRLNREQGVTVVAVLHDVNLASQYCDGIIVMKEGKTVAMGAPEETLRAPVLRRAFDVEVVVREDVVSGRPFVVPVQKLSPRKGAIPNWARVHLICGGGTGFELMERLAQAGVEVTAGVLNVGDTDYLVAKRLGLEVVEEAPFREISSTNAERCLSLIQGADALIMTPVPFGPANLKNLEIAEKALGNGAKVMLMNEGDVDSRDFIEGKATKSLRRLLNNGAISLPENSQEAAAYILNVLRATLTSENTRRADLAPPRR